MSTVVLDLDRPCSWPGELYEYLDEHSEIFLGWEAKQDKVPHQMYDNVLEDLASVLQPYEIVGWHCSRLTDGEIAHIRHNGMQLPDAEMLEHRIDALEVDNVLTPQIAEILRSENWADEDGRAKRVWFCFYPPRRAGEGGIERFFRHWGGEALYVCHESNSFTSALLSCIGTPCLVEANVPISLIKRCYNPGYYIYRLFLANRGWCTSESLNYEDFVAQPLSADRVRRIISYPDPDFLDLTSCADWRRPLTDVGRTAG